MKYRLGALGIIQPTVGKQLKESYARTQHLEGRTAMSDTIESLEKDRQIPRNFSHPTDIWARCCGWVWRRFGSPF